MSTESGMVLVPRVPTWAMVQAALASNPDIYQSDAARIYKAMLAAAPASPPTPALLKPAAHGDGNKKPSGPPNKPMSLGAYERANRK